METNGRAALKDLLYSLIPENGKAIGNITLRGEFQRIAGESGTQVSDDEYRDMRQALIDGRKVETGRGRGGSVRRVSVAVHVPPPFGAVVNGGSLAEHSAAWQPAYSDHASSETGIEQPIIERTGIVIEGEDDEDSESAKVDPNEEVSIEKADRSLSELHRWYRAGRLILDPEWQRNYVWSERQASKLVESFLMGIPVPVVYLAKTEEQKYEVIDGVQRLTSMFRFFDNTFQLRGIDALAIHRGKTFSGLPDLAQNRLLDSTLRTLELSHKTSKELLFVIFERLNTGGTPLSDMEIRNCIYKGKLNDLVKVLAKFDDFIKCLNQKGIERRMTDRLLVLRFLAFHEQKLSKAQSGLKKFFNDFLEQYRNPSERMLQEFESAFKNAMRAAFTIFGDEAFRLRSYDKKETGEWRSRVNASVFQVLATSFAEYDLAQLTKRADSIREEYLDLITTDEQWKDAVSSRTGKWVNLEYTFETWNARLKLCLAGTEPQDITRCFSRQLKAERFRSDPACQICNQRISSVDDAALDHEEHYWRGGKTIPSNARLVHRHCNLTRSHTPI